MAYYKNYRKDSTWKKEDRWQTVRTITNYRKQPLFDI